MADRALQFFKDGVPVTEGIKLENGKAKLGGWSTYEVWHVTEGELDGERVDLRERVGTLYCGEPVDLQPGWSFAIT